MLESAGGNIADAFADRSLHDSGPLADTDDLAITVPDPASDDRAAQRAVGHRGVGPGRGTASVPVL